LGARVRTADALSLSLCFNSLIPSSLIVIIIFLHFLPKKTENNAQLESELNNFLETPSGPSSGSAAPQQQQQHQQYYQPGPPAAASHFPPAPSSDYSFPPAPASTISPTYSAPPSISHTGYASTHTSSTGYHNGGNPGGSNAGGGGEWVNVVAAPPHVALTRTSSGGVSSLMPKDNIPIQDIDQAAKLSKYANSALLFNDVPTAINNLVKALQLLTNI
jgi:hypothetical protein